MEVFSSNHMAKTTHKFSYEFPNAVLPKLNGQQTHSYGARFENSQQASLGQPNANKTTPVTLAVFWIGLSNWTQGPGGTQQGHARPGDTQQGHTRPGDMQQGHTRPGDTQTGQQVVWCMTKKPSLSVQTLTKTWQLFVPCAQSTYLHWQKQKWTLQSSCEADNCTKYQDHISDTVCSKDTTTHEISFLEH